MLNINAAKTQRIVTAISNVCPSVVGHDCYEKYFGARENSAAKMRPTAEQTRNVLLGAMTIFSVIAQT